MTVAVSPQALDDVLDLLHRDGHDFRDYRRDVLGRRLAERMASLGVADVAAYLARLGRDYAERGGLVETLRVSTSGFFRPPELFAALRERVLGPLGRAAAGRPLRAWVAGVATGEEAWSLAMELATAEAAGGAGWELVASDVNPAAVATARVARYRAADAAAVPAERRARYLIADGDDVVVVDALRARVVFSCHDLLGPWLAPPEAVLARFALVLCQNVLIYLEARLQERLLARLLGVVAPGGVLGLGPYERPPAAAAARLERLPGVAGGVHLYAPRSAP